MRTILAIIFTLLLAGSAWGQMYIDSDPIRIYRYDDLLPFHIRNPVRYRTEIKQFDLCEDRKHTEFLGHVICKRGCDEVLTEILAQGWELQEPYRGEYVVWLKRQVPVKEEK